MNPISKPLPGLGKQLWRPPLISEGWARWQLHGLRLGLLALFVILVAVFVSILLAAARTPRTHLFLFEDRIPDYSVLENLLAFPPLVYPHQADSLLAELLPENLPAQSNGSPAAPRARRAAVTRLDALASTVRRLIQDETIRSYDPVLIYIRAQGTVNSEEPVFLAHTGNPKVPAQPIILGELVDTLVMRNQPAVLLLDYGTLGNDPAQGKFVNEFAATVHAELTARQQGNTWIICSHDLFEASYVSDRDQRSIFESVLSTGLSGAADMNLDGWVDVRELCNFLDQQIPARVRIESEGFRRQHPVFCWSGGLTPGPEANFRLIPSGRTRVASAAAEAETVEREVATPSSLFPLRFDPLLATWLQRRGARPATPAATPPAAPQGSAASSLPATSAEAGNGSPATSSAPTAAPSGAAPANGNGPPNPGAAPSSGHARKELEAILLQCWTIYEQLRQTSGPGDDGLFNLPVAFFAPREWKQLETLLVYATAIAQRPGAADLVEMRQLLQEQILPLQDFSPATPLTQATGVARAIDDAFPRQFLNWPASDSWELKTWVARQNRQPLSADETERFQTFRKAATAPIPAPMETWLTTNAPYLAQYEEARLIAHLRARDVEWPLCQQALETLGWQLRTRLNRQQITPRMRSLMGQGDELWQWGQFLLDAPHDGRDVSQVTRVLQTAQERYGRALEFCDRLLMLERIAWQAVCEVNATTFPAVTATVEADFSSLPPTGDQVRGLADLVQFLQSPELQEENRLNQIVAPLQAAFGDLWPPERSGNSFEKAAFPSRLAATARTLITQMRPPLASPSPTSPATNAVIEHLSLATLVQRSSRPLARWQSVRNLMELAFARARLMTALWGQSSPEFTRLQSAWQQTEHAFEELSTAQPTEAGNTVKFTNRVRSTHGNGKESADGNTTTTAVTNATANTAVKEKVVTATATEPMPASFKAACTEFCTAWRALMETTIPTSRRPVAVRGSGSGDGNGARRLFSVPYLDSSTSPQANANLNVGRDLAIHAVAIVATGLRQRLVDPVAVRVDAFRSRKLAALAIRPLVLDDLVPLSDALSTLPVQVQLPASLDLTNGSQVSFDVQLDSLSAATETFWIDFELPSTDFEFVLLPRVGDDSGVAAAVPATESVSAAVTDFRPLTRQIRNTQIRQPGISIAPQGSVRIPCQIRRRNSSATSGIAMLRVLTSDQILLLPVQLECGQENPLQLTLAAAGALVTPDLPGWSVKLLPNSASQLELRVDNLSSDSQKVNVQVFALPVRPTTLPSAAVPTAAANSLIDRWSAATLLWQQTAIEVPAQARQFPVGPALAGGAPPTGAAAGSGSSSGAPAADSRAAISPNWVIVFTNPALDLVQFFPVKLEILHPRDYVDTQVNYDAVTREMTFLLERLLSNPELDRPITARIALFLPGSTDDPVTFPMTIPAGDARALFQTQLPGTTSGEVVITVDLDRYPRARRFRIPAERTVRDANHDTEPQIRILAPEAGAAFRPDQSPIPVQLQVDLGFDSPGDRGVFLEFGIDVNQDRLLYNEPTVRLTTDRLPLVFQAESNSLKLTNTVTDLLVETPLANLTNRRVNLLGRVQRPDKDAWSTPVEIILDSAPPEIRQVSPLGPAVEGKPLTVLVDVTDGSLSGVASVQLLLDVDRTGVMDPPAQPIAATVNEQGRWQADIPIGMSLAGEYLLLARAFDRAGNLSRTQRTLIKILSTTEMEAIINAPDKTVRGQVLYGKQPVAGATIRLLDAAGLPVDQKQSDDQGRFAITRVPPGKFQLAIRAVERGKIRELSEAIEITPETKEVNRVFNLP